MRPIPSAGCLLLLAAALGNGAVSAQDEPDYEAIEVADERAPAWQPWTEVLLRGDRVTGLPQGREDLERTRLRIRHGGVWNPDRRGVLQLGFALEAAIGTGANKHSLINNDIEDVDGAGVDAAWLRWRWLDNGTLEAGKAPLPLDLSPMLWDADLRPLGLSLLWRGPSDDFDRWQLGLGVFQPDPLGERGPRLAAFQAGYHWHEGAPLSGGVLLGYLDYSNLDRFARAGLGRGNTLAAGRYRDDFHLLDLQLYLRRQLGEKAVEARLDLVRNLGADADDRGTRASVVYGDRFNLPGWELGWAWERMQRNAVLAAVTADDWWFHTASRGHMPWLGYGFEGGWSMRLAAFIETRDGLHEQTERVLLDLEKRW
jgi:hypothetical protein